LTGRERFGQGETSRFRDRSPALTVTSLSEADFTAEPVERLSGPETPSPAERRGLAVALIAAAALHLMIPLALLVYYAIWPPSTPTAVQEIPVEVVIEQPPPPPKPKPPEQKPKPPPEPQVEKPAYDAPAAETKENVNRESPDKKTEAPAAQVPPPPTPGAPPKSEAQAPAPAPAEEQKPQPAPAAHDLTPTPEGELPADVNPKPNNEAAAAAAPAAPPPPAKAPVGEALPTIEDLPQYRFAREAEHSPVTGGNAESRYLTIVYGMIKQHLRETAELHVDSANKRGVVDFYVDEGGNLIGRKLVNSSGSPNLDMAVMAAIAAAAPYPAPPNWSPLYLTYNFGRR
jgi:periplasmic protein TonB